MGMRHAPTIVERASAVNGSRVVTSGGYLAGWPEKCTYDLAHDACHSISPSVYRSENAMRSMSGTRSQR
jgi:hypothetical protein